MSTRKQPHLLKLLDKNFNAKFCYKDLLKLLSKEIINKLSDKGIFETIESTTIKCPLGEHKNNILNVIKNEQEEFKAFCPEHAKMIDIEPQDLKWVSFNSDKWIQAIRDANGIIDKSFKSKNGFFLIGTYRTSNQKCAIVFVSSQSDDEPLYFRPVEISNYIYIKCDINEPFYGENYTYLPADISFENNLIKLNKSHLGTALSKFNYKPESNSMKYIKFTHEDYKNGKEISIEDYEKILNKSNIKKYDLVINLVAQEAWIKGRKITNMDQKKNGKFRKLSPTGLKLIADYLRKPNKPLAPYRLGLYNGEQDSRDKTTAQRMLLNMRKSLKLKDVLKFTNNPSGTHGDALYSFTPPNSFKYLLIVAPEN